MVLNYLKKMNKSEYSIDELLLNDSFLNFYFKKNEEDVLDWEDWLEDDSERQLLGERAFGVLDRLSLKWSKAELDVRYQRVREELRELESAKIIPIEPITRRVYWWRYAAAASIVLTAATWFLMPKNNSVIQDTPSVSATEKPIEEPLKRALVRFFKLPDGTKVQLKVGSELTMADDFGKTERVVTLKGEAKFEVAHDANRPFRVKTDNVVTTALGTIFVARSAVNGKVGQVSLIEGKVKVEYKATINNDAPKAAVTLTEGTQVRFEKETPVFSEIEKLPSQIVNWQQLKVLSVDKMQLSEVFSKLSDTYGVRFEGVDKALANYTVTGMFDTNLPLSDIMEVLAFANDFKYKIQGKKVIILKG